MRRPALIGAAAVVLASVVGRLFAARFSLYLEPWAVTRDAHLWQLVTWVPTGASLTFLAHAALLGFALSRGAFIRVWLGATFIAGVLTALLAFVVPAVLSCTFAGAGVGATAALWGWARGLGGRSRWAAMALALVPGLLDGVVDGSYALLPHALVLPLAGLWSARLPRRS